MTDEVLEIGGIEYLCSLGATLNSQTVQSSHKEQLKKFPPPRQETVPLRLTELFHIYGNYSRLTVWGYLPCRYEYNRSK